MIKLDFEEYLLNENKNYLGEKIGDILTALQDLSQNGKAMGTRQLMRGTEGVCNQIRKVLHSNWQKTNEKYLPTVQKVGVALMKAAEEKDDLPSIIDGAVGELEGLLDRMKVPVNTLATAEPTPAEPATTAPPQGQQDQQPQGQQPPQPDPNAQQAPPPDPNAPPAPPGGQPPQPGQPPPPA